MKLRNTNPLGQVDLPLIYRQGEPFGVEGSGCLEPGEVFEVTDAHGKALLLQAGNYERVDKPTKSAAAKQPAAATQTTDQAGE